MRLLLCALLAASAPSTADVAHPEDTVATRPPALTETDAGPWFDGYMANALTQGDIAGAVVIVVRDGQVLFELGYGYADVAMLGSGITRTISYQVEASLRAGRLNRLLEPYEGPPIPVQFLYTAQGRLPLKLRALLDFAASRLRARRDAVEHALAALMSRKPRVRKLPGRARAKRAPRG